MRNKVRQKVELKIGADPQLMEFPTEPYHELLDTNEKARIPANMSLSDHERFVASKIAEANS